MGVLSESYTLSNGVTIPKIGFGTWQIPNGADAYNSVAMALEAGYRHIDTAYAYGNEESVGEAIRDSGLDRTDVFITSKLPAEVKTGKRAKLHFEATLKNLGTDYLDLYLIHAPWPWSDEGSNHDEGNQEVWKAFEKIYESGAARAIGVSNFDVHDLTSLLSVARVKPMVNQIQYYVGFTEPKITSFSKENGLLIEAYSPLATGDLLTNDTLKGLATKYGVTPAQIALRFCLDTGVLPLPKATSQAHIEANADLDFRLSDSDLTVLIQLDDAAPIHYHNRTQG